MSHLESVKIADFRQKWNTKMPSMIENTTNLIRTLISELHVTPNEKYEMIPLSLGDPSVFGNFPAPIQAREAVVKARIYFLEELNF